MWNNGATLELARRASGEDTLSLLGISASVIDIGVGESGRPHHDSTKCGIRAVITDKSGKGAWFEVVLCTASGSCGAIRGGRHTNEDFGI